VTGLDQPANNDEPRESSASALRANLDAVRATANRMVRTPIRRSDRSVAGPPFAAARAARATRAKG